MAHRIGALKGRWRSSANLPLALLLLALCTLFLFAADRGHFYRPGHHDSVTGQFLSLAESLSPEHNFALFHGLELDENGNPAPAHLYHRFPIGGFVLIKLAILPFGDDLSAKVLAARMLMLALFSAAAVLAYLALARITGSQWIACTATALAFSTRFCLYYSDMVSVEVPLDLFAVMLVFHALTIYVQEHRFRQLLAKVCVALLLGWHVYALLLPFIIFSLAIDAFRAYAQSLHAPLLARIRRLAGVLFLGRPTVLGAVALAFGSSVLGLQLLNEWIAQDSAAPSGEFSTLGAALTRTGIDTSYLTSAADQQRLDWPNFLEGQLHALGAAVLPFALPGYASTMQIDGNPNAESMFEDMFFVGVVALAICFVGLCFARQRLLLTTLTLFGFFWSLPMRHMTAWHDYEVVFYVGVPLTLFTLALLYMRRLSGEPLMARFAVVALLTFVFSSWQMSIVNHEIEQDDLYREVIADFQAIRHVTPEGVIGILSKETFSTSKVGYVPNPLRYYLSSSVLVPERHPFELSVDQQKLNAIEFFLTDERDPVTKTLTPKNSRFFLYDKTTYVGSFDTLLGDLSVQSNFDVYTRGDALTYFKLPCTDDDIATFFLHVYPEHSTDLPEHRRKEGYDNLDFAFHQRGVMFAAGAARACAAEVRLPTYAKDRIETGQFVQHGQVFLPIWSALLSLRKPPHPEATSSFSIHRHDNT